ncbi:UDP-glycosyltransferase UGT5 [Drosophila willistoni]|nr:UDP-glycosyltransferase UGT5 [Drosophila willistoni]
MLVSCNLTCTGLVFVALSVSISLTHAENILAIFSYAVGAPYLLVRPLIKRLVERGHEVTVVSSAMYFPTINGTHHIRVHKLDQLMQELSEPELDFPTNKWTEAKFVSYFYYYSSYHILADPQVQQILHNSSAHFDMIIVDTPHSDALCGFAKHFNAPMVGIAAYGAAWIVDYLAGNSAPSVTEPVSHMGYTYESTSLLNKWRNWIFLTEEWLLARLIYLPPQTKLYRQYFNDSYSNFDEIRRNFSLILVNQHFSLGRARSNVPNLIEIAGMHMCFQKDCKLDAMPEDLQRFMDEAEHGVIYFSMGIEILENWLPKHMIQTLSETFSKLKQRVVWKIDNWETRQNKSDNVFYGSYLPQQQILNHPNVKLFITHGGLLSIIETTYYGVPILSLPFYYDQFWNAQRMRLAGAGETLDLHSMNVEILNRSIHQILQNPSYATNIRRMSTQFRDQPMKPLETAVWWIEYVLRHKGAHYMRLAEHDMAFLQYYNIDLVSIILGRIGLTAIIVILLGYKLTTFFIVHSHMSLNIPLIR